MEATRDLVSKLPQIANDKLLVGSGTLDDASVYQLHKDLAIVLTVDLFPPVVDSPLHYGRIAAANSLSDVYAMGGEPMAVMNIFTYPFEQIKAEIAAEILQGGAEKAQEAGAVLAGGHTMRDTEIKYGLAVVGHIHPQKIFQNSTAQAGDDLVLTKPLGIGVITTALKKEILTEEDHRLKRALEVMERLNAKASQAMRQVEAHAATDITGFGLLGHAWEMASASGVSLEIYASKLPVLEGTEELLKKGCLSGGSKKNRKAIEKHLQQQTEENALLDIACDAQTSGGLLISLEPSRTKALLQTLQQAGQTAWKIGKVLPADNEPKIYWKT
ncbi:MAG: selenide, water dikinase SelD [Planctomycetota bacterium]|nr:MAG: selenide, water dikinase SelD [Planctomycetota bacterium]